MSWLNKFLKIFQDKEVTEFEEQTVMNYEERKTDNRVKELDARVTYQYPNGKFRFPLISDEEKLNITTNGKRLKRYERKQEATENATELYQEFRGHVIESTRKEPRVRFSERIQEEQKNHLKNRNQKDPIVTLNKRINQEQRHEPKELGTKIESRTKITKKGSRPFQPTEIPSPIYGFTKRTIPSEIVEFELESDEPLLNIEVTEHVNHTQDEKLIDNYYDEYDVTTKLETTVVDVADYIEVEIEDGIEVEIEDEIEVEIEDVIDDEIEVKIEDVIAEEIDEIEEETEELLEEKIETLKIQTSVELEQEDQKNVVPTDEIEKKPVQRSHLPFNVLMLKQDKRKWEQKVFEGPKQNNEIDTVILEKNEIQKNAIDISQPGLLQNGYIFPSLTLLNPPMSSYDEENIEWIENQEQLLNEALKNFGVRASVVNITQGPSVTRFEVQPEPGVKVNKITNLSDDIKLSLAAKDIRIEAPIPGKHTIGIEVPNKKSRPVFISEIIKSKEFQNSASPLTAVLGLDISGAPVVTDLKKMPHGLIAGATGSGKSVCINSILISLLFKASPQELKLLLIDPKMVELAPYNHIPHLVSPVITDVKAATASLKWAVDEMERRYELFAHVGVRDINRFNEIAESHKRYSEKLPFIVIIIDELADLMMMSPADVEESICRIAQKARACGIHLIIATQRPSVDVITGLIKANVPTRTAFSVSSQIDSRTIIDISGAEKLLGRGDMLFLENGSSKPVRLQGTFVSDEEIDMVVQHVRDQQEPQYLFHQEELLKKAQVIEDEDELFYEACEFVIDQGGASTSSVQRRFKIGYNRAARLIDMMEQQGFISEPKGSKPRDILITEEELEQIQETTSSTFI